MKPVGIAFAALLATLSLPLSAQVTVTTDIGGLTSTVAPTFDNFDGVYNTAIGTVSGGVLDLGTQPASTTANWLAADSSASTNITINLTGKGSYFGLLWGTPDAVNTISFYNGNTLVESFTAGSVSGSSATVIGSTLLPPYPAGATYVNFTASTSADDFTKVVLNDVLAPGGAYFEVDNLAATVTAVPEPAEWAMMLAGFGLMGAVVARRRTLPLNYSMG